MKFSLNNLSFKTILSRKKTKDKFKIEITPYRDWKIIGEVFFGLLIVLFAAHAYLFMRLQDDSFFTSKEVEAPIGFKKERVISTVEYYREKAIQFEARKLEKPSVVDPAEPR